MKAIKVVAGQEPELTCEFLIAFADCAANSDVDSEAAVRKTLNGEQAVNGPPLLKNNGSKDSGSKSDRSSNRLEDNDAKGGSGSMSMADAKDEAPIAPERGQSRSGSRGGARTSLPTADSAGLSDPIVNLDSELAKCDGSIAATQSLLGSVITRPKLSDKLLGKPPFKFLHDIVSEVIKSTGFGTNLFAPEEMDNSKVTGKEAKLAYLEKIIQLVGVQLQTNLRDVQPMKIIQGLEADSTNRFLQHLAVAAIHSPDSTNAVRTVLDQLGGTSNETPLQATANPAPDPVESEEPPPSKEITFAPSVAEDKNSASPRQMQPDDKNPNNHGMGIGAPPSNFNTPSSGFEEEKQVSMRPTSALRRPPKVKERTRDATHDFASTTVTKKAEGLIMDGEEIDEDEDILDGMGGDVKRLADDLQVVGAAVSSPAPANAESKIVQDIRNRQAEQEALSRGNISNPNFGADEKEEPLDGPGGEAKSGGIRLGKKKLSSRGSKSGSKDPNAGSSSSKSSSGSATDIEKLRNCIQMLVKYTGPLGSCMEYIQEDIGLMTNELKKWEEESRK